MTPPGVGDTPDFESLLAKLPSPTPPPTGLEPLVDMADSDGRPHEMTRTQRDLVRERLQDHFWDFAYVIGGCDILYQPLHGPVCDMVERHSKPGWKRLMVQLPRSALKSTLCTRTHALWRVVRDPNTTVAIFNEKVERVEKWIMAIQSIVSSNPLFQTLWPEIIPPGLTTADRDKGRKMPRDWKWSSKELLFQRTKLGIPEATITAMSVGGASAGGHWEWLLFDDLISNEAQQSRTVMQSVKEWFDTSIYLGPTPETANMWISCTRWHYDDVYEHARKYHGFSLYRRAAIEEGASAWPSRWTLSELQKDQQLRPMAFAAQMMNDPIAGENTAFDITKLATIELTTRNGVEGALWVNYDPTLSVIDEEAPQWVPLNQLNKILLVDPAPSTEGERRSEPNARNALVVKACDAWGRRYWLDVWAGREGPIERAHRILKLLLQWGTPRLAVEEVAAQKEIIPWVRDLARREYKDCPISYTALKPGRRDKDSRIAGLAGSVAGGWEGALLHLKPTIFEEMISYPYSRTRDILDAAAYDRDPGVLGRPESPWEEDEREYSIHANHLETGRDEQTGY